MRRTTDTLEVGSTAPLFTLQAANRDGSFSLAEMIAHKPVIVEFMRGTW